MPVYFNKNHERLHPNIPQLVFNDVTVSKRVLIHYNTYIICSNSEKMMWLLNELQMKTRFPEPVPQQTDCGLLKTLFHAQKKLVARSTVQYRCGSSNHQNSMIIIKSAPKEKLLWLSLLSLKSVNSCIDPPLEAVLRPHNKETYFHLKLLFVPVVYQQCLYNGCSGKENHSLVLTTP